MRNWIIGLIIISIILVASFAWGIHVMKVDWLQAGMLVFTYYGMLLILFAAVMKPRKFPTSESYAPFVSILIPARNEEHVIENTIRSLTRLDYLKGDKPNFEIILMDDNSQDRTLETGQRLEKEFPGLVRAVHRTPDIAGKGKSLVLNHGVEVSRGEVIAVFDADTNVCADFLKKSIPLLTDPKVGGLQGRVRLYNKNTNLLTSLQEDEFAAYNHLYQLGKELIGGVTALGGNGQLVKRSALNTVDGWNWLSPTEDLDLTFRLMFKGWDIRYAPDAVLYQEGVESVQAFLRQRIRWAEGFLKCIFDYTVPLIFSRTTAMKKIDGIMTMIRVLIPLFVLIGYLFIGYSVFKGVEFTSGISPELLAVSSWAFLVALTVGITKIFNHTVFHSFYRVMLYSFFSIFWVIAVPVGFLNCIRNINDIYWDKTVHTGKKNKEQTLSKPSRYSEAGSLSLEAVD